MAKSGRNTGLKDPNLFHNGQGWLSTGWLTGASVIG